MSNFSLQDVLAQKKEGEEWYSFQLPEEFHMWTLTNQWKNGAFKKYDMKISKLSISGEIESHKSEIKFNQRAPLFLDCGVDLRKGNAVTKTTSTASFGLFNADSAVEINEILEELSRKYGIQVWTIKTIWLYTSNGRELNFKRHNPNGTGVSLYFFKLKDLEREVLYPDVSLNEQQQLVNLMKLTLAHCTAVERKEMVHGCAIEVMKKKKKGKTSTGWMKVA